MALRFWVGSSGNWSDTGHWSTSSGGAGGASVPAASDDVVIDDNSSGVSLNIQLTSDSVSVSSLVMTNGLFDTTFVKPVASSFAVINVGGNLGFSRARATAVTFWMQGAGFLTQSNALDYNSSSLRVTIDVGAVVNLTTSLSVFSLGVAGGLFRTNGNTLTASSVSTNLNNVEDARTLDIEGSTINSRSWSIWNTPTTLHADGSTLDVQSFSGGGKTYDAVTISEPSTVGGSNNFSTLRLLSGSSTFNSYMFSPSETQTVGNLIVEGTASNSVRMKSLVSGQRFRLRQASGVVNATFIDVKDSDVGGGAIWSAYSSINSGNNTGWNFIGPTNATVELSSFSNATSYGNPSFYTGNAIRQLAGSGSTLSYGNLTVGMKISSGVGATSTQSFGAMTILQSPPPPPPPTDWAALSKAFDKQYVYRVYRGTTFLGTWVDVEDSPQFTQRINTPGTTMTVQLARSPNTTKEVRASLTTQAGDILQTEDGYDLAVTYETNNSVGDGTDVDINLNVDVYVHYGEFSNLITQAGDLLTTEDGFELMVGTGAPTGRRLFSGYILDYELGYGQANGVVVTLASHGTELSQSLVRSGETVVVDYASQELSTTLKSILDTNPGKMTYSLDSVVNTGVSAAFKFQLNSKLEAIESVYDQTPDGWYWFGDVAENVIALKQKESVPDHTFKIGYHVKSMSLKRTAEQLRNLVYFVGKQDEVTGVSILKKFQDLTSQSDWRVGLHRITDRRYSVAANMQRRAEKDMQNYKVPVWTTTVTVSAAKYDIETIKLGQVVAFSNVDGAIRDLQLQIMSLSYGRSEVSLQIGGYLDSQAGLIEETSDSLLNEQFQTIPNAPS